MAFSRAERVMHVHWTLKPGFDKDTLLAYFKKSNPSKAVSLVLPGLSRCKCHPSVSGSQGGKQMRGRRAGKNKQLNVRVGHKNQLNEERMRSTHPRKRQRLVVMHGTTATIRPRHPSRNFAAITKFLTRKLIISQILSVSRNFCASKIWSYTV